MDVRIVIGDLLFDVTLRRLTSGDGHSSTLTPKAAALLRLLADASPEALSHEAIYDSLWPGTFVEPGNLHNLVAEVRAAAGEAGVIRTVHRFGYALRDAARREVEMRFALVAGDMRIPLCDGETVVGREMLPFSDVSRRHARFIVQGDDVTVEDLGSKNGTFVNARRIDRVQHLRGEDALVIGRTVARLVNTGGAATATADAPLSESSESGRDR